MDDAHSFVNIEANEVILVAPNFRSILTRFATAKSILVDKTSDAYELARETKLPVVIDPDEVGSDEAPASDVRHLVRVYDRHNFELIDYDLWKGEFGRRRGIMSDGSAETYEKWGAGIVRVSPDPFSGSTLSFRKRFKRKATSLARPVFSKVTSRLPQSLVQLLVRIWRLL